MREPAYILKNETKGINGEKIVLYYFTCENTTQRKAYGIGIDMYIQDHGMRTTKERKVVDNVFFNKRDAEKFLEIICRCFVTPTSLEDVIYDHKADLEWQNTGIL